MRKTKLCVKNNGEENGTKTKRKKALELKQQGKWNVKRNVLINETAGKLKRKNHVFK